MDQSPWHQDRSLPFHYYMVVPHPREPAVLLVPGGGGWTLPHFTPTDRDFRSVGHIEDELRDRFGLEAFVLRCLKHRYDAQAGFQCRVYEVEVLTAMDAPPAGGRWLRRDSLVAADLPPELGDALESWFDEAEAGVVPHDRVPWARRGWYSKAADWTIAELSRLDRSPTGPLEHIRSWSLSCILRAPTASGAVYFKAVPPIFAAEPEIARFISERLPGEVPPALATDADRGWMLSEDQGNRHLYREPDVAHWERALRQFAQLQVGLLKSADELLTLGASYRGLDRLESQIAPLFAGLEADRPSGLSGDEIDRARSFVPRLREMCGQLAEYGIPHGVMHGDLGGNVLIRDGGYVFFDWTDTCIAHPFLDMAPVLDTVFDEGVIDDVPNVRRRLRDAYLEPWTAFDSPERLLKAADLARPLGAVHQALTYVAISESLEPAARSETEDGLRMWLRVLLRDWSE